MRQGGTSSAAASYPAPITRIGVLEPYLRRKVMLGSDQVCPNSAKPASQPLLLFSFGQPFFHMNLGVAGSLASIAYTTRPPRRMPRNRYTLSPSLATSLPSPLTSCV